jgi:hypothetical protein
VTNDRKWVEKTWDLPNGDYEAQDAAYEEAWSWRKENASDLTHWTISRICTNDGRKKGVIIATGWGSRIETIMGKRV